MVQPGAAAGQQTTVPAGLQLGLGTRAASNEIIFTQGNFTQTDNPLDLVIQGNGFFQIRHADRAPRLHARRFVPAGPERQHGRLRAAIRSSRRSPFRPTRNRSPSPPTARSATLLPGQTAAQKAGQIQIAMFQNPAGLNSIGKNLYQPTDASGDPTVATPGGQEGLGTLLQGYTEQSNVSMVEEFINLIVAQRAYEANSKVVKAADEMYQQVNNLKQ